VVFGAVFIGFQGREVVLVDPGEEDGEGGRSFIGEGDSWDEVGVWGEGGGVVEEGAEVGGFGAELGFVDAVEVLGRADEDVDHFGAIFAREVSMTGGGLGGGLTLRRICWRKRRKLSFRWLRGQP